MIDLSEIKSKEERIHYAENNYNRVVQQYQREIKQCIENTHRYCQETLTADELPSKRWEHTDILFLDTDSVTCLFDNAGNDVALLNFASFKNPGGMYLNGSPAQEESLCHQSILYPVLEAFREPYYKPHLKQLNYALYIDDMLYTRDVAFFDYELKDMGSTYKDHVLKRVTTADVITCAAPNVGSYWKYRAGTLEESKVSEIVANRIDFVINNAIREGRSEIILGAFGCGVFGNDPEAIAYVFRELLTGCYDGYFKTAYFPIPSGNKNFQKFVEVFMDMPTGSDRITIEETESTVENWNWEEF